MPAAAASIVGVSRESARVSNPFSSGMQAWRRQSSLVRELLLFAVALLVGIVAIPIGVYVVGAAVLGTYGTGDSLWTFWGDYLSGLGTSSLAHWLLALGPYVLLWLLRGTMRALR